MDKETLSEMPKATGIVMGTTAENASNLGAWDKAAFLHTLKT